MKLGLGIVLPFLVAGLAGCGNKVNFSSVKEPIKLATPIVVSPTQPDPVPVVIDDPPPTVTEPEPQPEPPVVVVPEPPPVVVEPPPPPVVVIPEEPNLNLKSGACPVGGGKVLSCLECASKNPVMPAPLLSGKAQKLLEIMTAGCSVFNKSDAPGYKAPSYEQIQKRLIHCSPTLYPESSMNATQTNVIYNLLNNAAAQKNAFGGLYYNSASVDFETYFGLTIQEARNTLCRREAAFGSNGVYPIEYYDSLYSGRPYTLPAVYVKAQTFRSQLRNCMARSVSLPNPIQDPVVPGVKCSYETAEGQMGQKIIDQFYQWKNAGHTVYFEGFGQCGVMEKPESYLEFAPKPIKLAIKTCLETN